MNMFIIPVVILRVSIWKVYIVLIVQQNEDYYNIIIASYNYNYLQNKLLPIHKIFLFFISLYHIQLHPAVCRPHSWLHCPLVLILTPLCSSLGMLYKYAVAAAPVDLFILTISTHWTRTTATRLTVSENNVPNTAKRTKSKELVSQLFVESSTIEAPGSLDVLVGVMAGGMLVYVGLVAGDVLIGLMVGDVLIGLMVGEKPIVTPKNLN